MCVISIANRNAFNHKNYLENAKKAFNHNRDGASVVFQTENGLFAVAKKGKKKITFTNTNLTNLFAESDSLDLSYKLETVTEFIDALKYAMSVDKIETIFYHCRISTSGSIVYPIKVNAEKSLFMNGVESKLVGLGNGSDAVGYAKLVNAFGESQAFDLYGGAKWVIFNQKENNYVIQNIKEWQLLINGEIVSNKNHLTSYTSYSNSYPKSYTKTSPKTTTSATNIAVSYTEKNNVRQGYPFATYKKDLEAWGYDISYTDYSNDIEDYLNTYHNSKVYTFVEYVADNYGIIEDNETCLVE